MATTCPVDLDTARLRQEIQTIYARVNGVLSLAPDKRQAFREVFRILKPGGQFLYGDIVVASELSESIRGDIDLWTG